MKIIQLVVGIIFFCSAAQAQTPAATPNYERIPEVPPFNIVRVPDSTRFTKSDLRKKTPVIIMIFSPDCEHCQHATEDLIANIAQFKKVQIVMATALDYKYIVPFYERYQLNKYPNITVGRDGSYFLGTFYDVTHFPSIYLYSKKRKFVEKFVGDVSFKKIAEKIN